MKTNSQKGDFVSRSGSFRGFRVSGVSGFQEFRVPCFAFRVSGVQEFFILEIILITDGEKPSSTRRGEGGI